jgi:hypothetical protein
MAYCRGGLNPIGTHCALSVCSGSRWAIRRTVFHHYLPLDSMITPGPVKPPDDTSRIVRTFNLQMEDAESRKRMIRENARMWRRPDQKVQHPASARKAPRRKENLTPVWDEFGNLVSNVRQAARIRRSESEARARQPAPDKPHWSARARPAPLRIPAIRASSACGKAPAPKPHVQRTSMMRLSAGKPVRIEPIPQPAPVQRDATAFYERDRESFRAKLPVAPPPLPKYHFVNEVSWILAERAERKQAERRRASSVIVQRPRRYLSGPGRLGRIAVQPKPKPAPPQDPLPPKPRRTSGFRNPGPIAIERRAIENRAQELQQIVDEEKKRYRKPKYGKLPEFISGMCDYLRGSEPLKRDRPWAQSPQPRRQGRQA